MYICDKRTSGVEGYDESRQRVVRPSQRARFYPIPHSNLSGLGESGGTMSLLTLPNPFLNLDQFGYKSFAVPAIHKTSLEKLAKSVVDSQQSPQRIIKIRLVGHTDNVGDGNNNEKLGADRAGSVKVLLEREIGNLRSGLVTGPTKQVDIVTESRGERVPLTMDRTKNLLNRRVELFITLSPAPVAVTPGGPSGSQPSRPDLTVKENEGFDFREANRKLYEEAARRAGRLPEGPAETNIRARVRAKATDFLRRHGLSLTNAERLVDLGERGAKAAFNKSLEEFGVGSQKRDAIVNGLRAIMKLPF
ncbi:MAG TPA: OmpA family protein [Pyrinomonadaceae bacterium]|nr:OmpA family protein [Pyrinomonadaceae bacterium]